MNFTLTKEELQIIMVGLAELPAKHSFNLMNNLLKQQEENLKPSKDIKDSDDEGVIYDLAPVGKEKLDEDTEL